MRLGRREWRWGVVAAGTVVLVLLPLAAHVLPGGDSTITARTLLQRIKSSSDVSYSGYAQSDGGLTLPLGDRAFDGVGDLLGGQSRLRAWWRGDDDWRVDAIDATGETDLHRDGSGYWRWDYEDDSARRIDEPEQASVRLPRTDDLLPPALARRLVSEVDDADVRRLDGVRVAGHETAGLRLRVTDRRSTVDHIDVWALPDSGLPVRVEARGRDGSVVVTSRFLDLDTDRPSAATTGFRPAGTDGGQYFPQRGDGTDVLSFVDRYASSKPPASVAGLARRTDLNLGAIGVYGRGVTQIVAIPLTSRFAGVIVPAARRTPGSTENDRGISAASGPISLQLSAPAGYGARWLLVGTVSRATLRAAIGALPPIDEDFGYYRDRSDR